MEFKKYPFLLILLLAVTSCKKSEDTSSQHDDNIDVYIAGNNDNKAALWKNDKLIPFSSAYSSSDANGIAVQDNDIYVAGNYVADGTDVYSACYWKNGALNKLTNDEDSYARAIALNEKDVYIVGSYNVGGPNHPMACIWKNGVRVALSSSEEISIATAVAVKGDDVYISGYLYPNTKRIPVYWKNGIITVLPFYSTTGSNAADIAISSNNNLYITGFDLIRRGIQFTLGVAVYWEGNAYKQLISDANEISLAKAIALQGNDVYCAGSTYKEGPNSPLTSIAVYWKNNVLTRLTDASAAALTVDIAVHEKDVYVTGAYDFGSLCAVYWKNNRIVRLSNLYSSANSIALVPR